jgi:hypothetical protein
MSRLNQEQELRIRKLSTGDCEPGGTGINISNIAQKIFSDNTTKCVQEQLNNLGTEVTAALSTDTIASAVASGIDLAGILMWFVIAGIVGLIMYMVFKKLIM